MCVNLESKSIRSLLKKLTYLSFLKKNKQKKNIVIRETFRLLKFMNSILTTGKIS